MKYLAIKNWEKHQTGKGKMRWIKLDVRLEEDDDMLDLSIFQQGLLVMLWRLRGRSNGNLPNDPLKLCRKLSIEGQERHNAVRAIGQLIVSGWLIPTDEQDTFLNRPLDIEEEKKEKREEEKPTVATMPPPKAEPKITFLGSERKTTTFDLPVWVPEEQWFGWEQMRMQLKPPRPLTNHGRKLAVSKLGELMNKGHPPKDVLEQSILNSWQGLFELKGNYGNRQVSKAEQRRDGNLAALAEAKARLDRGTGGTPGGGVRDADHPGANHDLCPRDVPLQQDFTGDIVHEGAEGVQVLPPDRRPH